MHAGRVVCRLLESRAEYARRALLRLEKKGQTDGHTDRQTDGRHTITLRFPPDAASATMRQWRWQNLQNWHKKDESQIQWIIYLFVEIQ